MSHHLNFPYHQIALYIACVNKNVLYHDQSLSKLEIDMSQC